MVRRILPVALAILTAAPPAAAQTERPAAARVLLDQASYWLQQAQYEPAQRALDQLLRLEPRSPDALALQAQLQAARGNRRAALESLAALREARPDDPRLATIEQTLRVGTIDPAALEEARRLGREGRAAEAVARYQRLFQGPPPGPLAVEYYQTLAGTDGGWEQARDGLARLAANPQDRRAQLAYAELLTYRPQTRQDGIGRLAGLAQDPATAARAQRAWRQALEWLPLDASAIPAYEAYLARRADDAIAQRLQTARNPPLSAADVAGKQRQAGFAALEAGRLQEAEAAFRAVLAANENDADALGGLGLVRLRQNQTASGRDLLARAIAADPAHRSRWDGALAGAGVGDEYERAGSLMRRGRLAEAEQVLRGLIARGGNTAGAQAMLADVLARRGDLAGAEALLDRAGAAGSPAAGRVRAEGLRQRAATLSDPAQKVGLLRAAAAAAPADPWIRLDLARALTASGQKAEARAEMAGLAEGRASAEALRAAALFAIEDDRPEDAVALATRLSPAARGPELQALLAQAQARAEIRDAVALGATSRMAARQKLLALAAAPDPDGGRGVAIARGFMALHDPAGAREALAIAQAGTRTPTPAQRLAYAGALLSAGDDAGARALLASLPATGALTPAQQQALQGLRNGLAVRAADALGTQGRPADAYDQLAPALAASPDDPGLNLALARLYRGTDDARRALEISLAVLARDPADMATRRAAVQAAIAARDWERAEALAREGTQVAPNDPVAWLAAAELARARGNARRALQDLRTARSLREQQVGIDGAGGLSRALPSGFPPAVPAANPFRAGATVVASATPGAGDATLGEIDGQIGTLRQELAPKLSLGPSLRVRSGSAGLDRLSETTVPLEMLVMPLGRGRASIGATPTFLDAGQLASGTTSQAQFGTAAFGSKPLAPSQHAEGVGLSAAYELGWLKADIGSTPLGFPLQALVGGVEVSPALNERMRLRLRGERRAVTDSVLSYAGTHDTTNNTLWGGVTRLGGHAQMELSLGDALLYGGGGGARLTGRGVAPNTMLEFGAGGSTAVWRQGGEEVRLGLDLVYFGYGRNLRYFSLGQGGYFSPQSYMAAMVPVTYTSRGEGLTWSVGGAVGYQTYRESASPVFPNDARLQWTLQNQAASDTVTTYPGRSASGLAGNLRGNIEYRISPSLTLGGRAGYQATGNWNEFAASLYARYIFNGDTW
ncbi:cellulose biosynthesis protein BcsC [Rhodovastum atsumiense]|nr:cellulose biosynthesis protein BcsC [Rhodovastum atsumiense]